MLLYLPHRRCSGVHSRGGLVEHTMYGLHLSYLPEKKNKYRRLPRLKWEGPHDTLREVGKPSETGRDPLFGGTARYERIGRSRQSKRGITPRSLPTDVVMYVCMYK